MIQVLSRAAKITDFLAAHRGADMQDIAKAAKLKFTTACNIVRALVDLGWVHKEDGRYSIGPALTAYASNEARKNILALIAEEQARVLVEEINEGVVISMLHGGEKFNLVKITPERELSVSESIYFQRPPYVTADGRILFAYADEAVRAAVIERFGMPGDLWNGIRTASALSAAVLELKQNGIAIRSSDQSEVCGVAVPIPAGDGIWGALGVFLPAQRFTGERKDVVIDALKRTAKRISDMLGQKK